MWLYTQDSEAEVWNDERSWAKSNPMLGVVKKISELRDLVEEARNNGAQRAFTLAKEFNIKQLSSRAWLREADIIECDGTFDIADFAGCWCIVGVDLGYKIHRVNIFHGVGGAHKQKRASAKIVCFCEVKPPHTPTPSKSGTINSSVTLDNVSLPTHPPRVK